MEILGAATYERVAWKNGGGVTDVIAVAPGERPAWRISVARIERDGLFSDFTGYDRTIVSLAGGVTLAFAAGAERRLATLVPFAFPGEAVVEAQLTNEPVADFNVMTLRETHRHTVAVIGVGANGIPIRAEDICGFLYVAKGRIEIDGRVADAGDTARLEAGENLVAKAIAGPSTTILVGISSRVPTAA